MTTEDLKSTIKWWESKRLTFNILVGISGVFGIFHGLKSSSENMFLTQDLIRILTYGIIANIIFSSGILVEILDDYYFNQKLKVKKLRIPFLIFGLITYCLFTFFNAWFYYARPDLW